ncbi:hypothetical protein BJ085DRAFT_32770 [Dimargaris cristalligena]|uniref:SAP domain-containing protein n=1 Tax=Dimargaris cristalligena TaxID=215637 RepID=A0A4P9ZJH5_9FUNG|nr:hypothetical protein BJ085DRAFT_32770 [Dimargaris cristalligena]|eukprot:RKP33396.1 hypothetical protein BJ085DRAFT_32770 [Dimargaris cristalligena]
MDVDQLSKMKVAELKEICASLGLSQTGKKDDLKARIVEHNAQKADTPVAKKVKTEPVSGGDTPAEATGKSAPAPSAAEPTTATQPEKAVVATAASSVPHPATTTPSSTTAPSNDATSPSKSDTSPAATATSPAPAVVDAEEERRRQRASRFGITYRAPPKTTPSTTTTAAATKQSTNGSVPQ